MWSINMATCKFVFFSTKEMLPVIEEAPDVSPPRPVEVPDDLGRKLFGWVDPNIDTDDHFWQELVKYLPANVQEFN